MIPVMISSGESSSPGASRARSQKHIVVYK
nr:MAG TPA: hypothetical protein [Herelleviridae sp.]